MTLGFLHDVRELRKRAREHIDRGGVTPGYQGELDVVLRLLNAALATEIVCVLRYTRHYYMAKGIDPQAVAAAFLEHAREEQGHADEIAARITELGGEPDLDPSGLQSRSRSAYAVGGSLVDMIREDLIAERIAIESYGDIIRYLGDSDPATRRMLEGILAAEQEHGEEMADLLATLDPASKARQDEERRPG